MTPPAAWKSKDRRSEASASLDEAGGLSDGGMSYELHVYGALSVDELGELAVWLADFVGKAKRARKL